MRSPRHAFLSLGLLALVACGGAVEPVSDPTPSSSSTTPPPPSSGAKTGRESAGSGSATGNGALCEARPACDEGDTQVESESGCHNDGPWPTRCYTREACGEKIWCTGSACAEHPRPACLPGWQEVTICPQDASCTSVTFCGQSILCMDLAGAPGGG